jgi:hypothetical protein
MSLSNSEKSASGRCQLKFSVVGALFFLTRRPGLKPTSKPQTPKRVQTVLREFYLKSLPDSGKANSGQTKASSAKKSTFV